MLDAKAREALQGFSNLMGRALARLGFTANIITTIGIVLVAFAAWRIADGGFLVAGIILAIGGFLDFCDGAVAKVRGTTSRFGAFFDSVSDRLSDALVFSALAWFYFAGSDDLMFGVTLAAYGGAQLTSYIRARAESLDYDCRVGILERAERLILLCVGLILGFEEIMLWAIASLGLVTVVQRLVHVARQARADR